MNPNPNATTSRIQIFFYSLLITLISGVNRIRGRADVFESYPTPSSSFDHGSIAQTQDTTGESSGNNGLFFIQAFLPLVIWIILGFAAGFLIGTIGSR